MMGNAKLALLFVSLTVFACNMMSVEGYSGGAPSEACEDMLPQHGAPAQTKESPYTLTPNRKSVKAGESITLTLAAKDSSKFKGFMIHAVDNNGTPIGSFMPLPASKANNEFKGKWKLVTCPKGPANNTASHVNAVEKSRVVLTWVAPANLNQSFKFKYTVAKNGGEYWVGKETEAVSVTSTSSARKH